MWDCLTKPEYRAILIGFDPHKVTGRSDGRIGPGSIYYSAHGVSATPQTIVAWQPFDQFTIEDAFMGAAMLNTLRLKSSGDTMQLTILCGKSKGPILGRIVSDLGTRLFAPRSLRKGCRELRAMIDQEIAEGKIVLSAPTTVEPQRSA